MVLAVRLECSTPSPAVCRGGQLNGRDTSSITTAVLQLGRKHQGLRHRWKQVTLILHWLLWPGVPDPHTGRLPSVWGSQAPSSLLLHHRTLLCFHNPRWRSSTINQPVEGRQGARGLLFLLKAVPRHCSCHFSWAEHTHRAMPSCKGGWEVSPFAPECHVPTHKGQQKWAARSLCHK